MHIDLKLGLSCNNYCCHCIMEPVRKRLAAEQQAIDSSFTDIERLIDTLGEQNCTSITLTGGEPTLRKDFFDILHRVAMTSISITVQSNGRLLGKEKALHALADLSRRDILFVIALHGDNSKLHDAVTNVPGSFQETVAAIQSLMTIGFPVCGKMVLSRYNVSAAADTLMFMAKLGIDDALVAFPHAEDFTEDVLKKMLPRYAEIRDMLQAVAAALYLPKVVRWETIPFCVFPNPAFFSSSMDLEFLKAKIQGLGTIIEMSMTNQRINWEESRKTIKTKPQQCQECLLDYVCEGVWQEYLEFYGGKDLVPIRQDETVHSFLETL